MSDAEQAGGIVVVIGALATFGGIKACTKIGARGARHAHHAIPAAGKAGAGAAAGRAAAGGVDEVGGAGRRALATEAEGQVGRQAGEGAAAVAEEGTLADHLLEEGAQQALEVGAEAALEDDE